MSVFSWHSFTFMSVAISFLLGGGSAEEGRQKKKNWSLQHLHEETKIANPKRFDFCSHFGNW